MKKKNSFVEKLKIFIFLFEKKIVDRWHFGNLWFSRQKEKFLP